jgi:hypothetical protein
MSFQPYCTVSGTPAHMYNLFYVNGLLLVLARCVLRKRALHELRAYSVLAAREVKAGRAILHSLPSTTPLHDREFTVKVLGPATHRPFLTATAFCRAVRARSGSSVLSLQRDFIISFMEAIRAHA